jgi:hypothetical protein
MTGTRLAAAAVLACASALLGAAPARADELDAGFTEPSGVFAVPEGLYLVTDVYAGDVVASSGSTTTYTTVTVRDTPGTYARVIDAVGTGVASAFDGRSINGRAHLLDGRGVAGTYYEDFVLTPSGYVPVNIVFFQDDSETRAATGTEGPEETRRPGPGGPESSVAPPATSPSPPSTEEAVPTVTHQSGDEPERPRTQRTTVATAGIALAASGPALGSIELLRGRTVELWPRAFADGLPVTVRGWRLVSGSADLVSRESGTALEPCAVSWLSFAADGAPRLLGFEVTSDAVPGRIMTATIAVTLRSPALLH